MHEISDETLQEAQDHALETERHGEQTRDIAKRLEQSGCLTEAQREQVENCGELMQQSAQGILEAVNVAHTHPEDSTEAYGLAVERHVQANQQHLKAMQILLKAQQHQQAQPPLK